MNSQAHWNAYQRVLRAAIEALETGWTTSPSEALLTAAAVCEDTGGWVNHLLMSASADIVICEHCGRSAKYGIETLAQTGHLKEAIRLLKSRVVPI